MRVVLLGDSHLARVRRDLVRLGDDVLNAAVGGSTASDLLDQAHAAHVGPDDAVVVSVGSNDARRGVPLAPFAETLADFLAEVVPHRLVYLAPADATADAHAEHAVTAFRAAGAAVVDGRVLLAALGPAAFEEDALHLGAAAYDVVLGALRAEFDRRSFVVQLHQATNLHHDFRLEVDGVLVSWAVPKGPAPEPGVKRLAVKVGDHDLAHARVEGPQGRGWVEIWDRGDYENLTARGGVPLSMAEGLEAGHLKIRLYGGRLDGPFALTRTRMGGDDRNWILVALKP